MMIDRDWLIAGIDIPIFDYEIVMHNPSVREILTFGEQNFFIALEFLTIDKDDLLLKNNIDLSQFTNFDILMEVLNSNDGDKKAIIKNFLEMLFPETRIYITIRSIVFQNDNNNLTIDGNNFDILKNVLEEVFGIDLDGENSEEFKPVNKKAAEIAAKLERARQKRAVLKGYDADKATGLLAKNISIVAVGLNLDYNSLLDMTMFQLLDVTKRMVLKVQWDLYIKQLLVGGKPEEIDSWLEKDFYRRT